MIDMFHYMAIFKQTLSVWDNESASVLIIPALLRSCIHLEVECGAQIHCVPTNYSHYFVAPLYKQLEAYGAVKLMAVDIAAVCFGGKGTARRKARRK